MENVPRRRPGSRARQDAACDPGPRPPPGYNRCANIATRLAGLAAILLGWRPDDFWNATPAELAAALAPLANKGGHSPASPADLSRLMEHFPDG